MAEVVDLPAQPRTVDEGTPEIQGPVDGWTAASEREPVISQAPSEGQRSAELEAMIAEAPYDDHGWSVFEDCLLEAADPRAAIIHAQKSKRTGSAPREAIAKLGKLLLGPRAKILLARLGDKTTWRAGFIQDAIFEHEAKAERLLVGQLLATPAARLLRSLHVTVHDYRAAREIVDLIAESPCVRSLRRLHLGHRRITGITDKSKLDLRTAFMPLSLEELSVVTGEIELDHVPSFARLRSLRYSPKTSDLARTFPVGGYPELRELSLNPSWLTPDWQAGTAFADGFASVLSLGAAPKLERLEIEGSRRIAPKLIEALAPSPLLKQLRVLVLGREGRDSTNNWAPIPMRICKGERLGPTFAHLAEVQLPHDLVLPGDPAKSRRVRR